MGDEARWPRRLPLTALCLLVFVLMAGCESGKRDAEKPAAARSSARIDVNDLIREATSLAQTGREDEAEKMLRGFLESNPPDQMQKGFAMTLLSVIQRRQLRWKEARTSLEQCISLLSGPQGEALMRGICQDGLAMVLVELGDLSGAEIRISEALETKAAKIGIENPIYALSLHNRGTLRARQGRFEEAIADIKLAMQIHERSHGLPAELQVFRRSYLEALRLGGHSKEAAMIEKTWNVPPESSNGTP